MIFWFLTENKETNSKSNSNTNFNPDTKNLNELNNNLASLMEQMQNMSANGGASNTSFINDILKKQNQYARRRDTMFEALFR